MLPVQGAQVQSLVGELDPTCMPQLRVRMPQLRSPHAATKHSATKIPHAATKIPRASTKTWRSLNKQTKINKKINIKKKKNFQNPESNSPLSSMELVEKSFFISGFIEV